MRNTERSGYSKAAGSALNAIGTDITKAKTLPNAMKAAGLDWEVSVGTLKGTRRVVENRVGIERSTDGKVLGIVSPVYQLFQNREGFSFIDALLEEGLILERGGELRGGRIVYVVARFPQTFKVADDVHVPRMLFQMGHGCGEGAAIRGAYFAEREWCNNQMPGVLATTEGEAYFRVIHNSKMRTNLEKAKAAMRLAAEQQKAVVGWLRKTTTVKVSEADILRTVEAIFGPLGDDAPAQQRRKAETFQDILGQEIKVNGLTAYSLVNTVTGYANHALTYQGDGPARAEARFRAVFIQGNSHNFARVGLSVIRDQFKKL